MTQDPQAPQEILDLNELAPEHPLGRLKWTTKGENGEEVEHEELFELAIPEDFGAVDLARMGRLFTEHDKLWEADERDSAEDRRLEKLLDEIARKLIPDAPAAAVKAVPALHKRGLAVRFFVGAGIATQPTMAGMERKLSVLASNSPGSAASTVEVPSTG